MSNPELEAEAQPGRPDWLLPNFQSVEEQARSYAESRAEMGRAQARANEVEQAAQYYMERNAELEDMVAQQEQAPQPLQDSPEFNPLVAQYEQAVENGDVRTQLALTAYVASQIADQKVAAAKPTEQPENPVMNEFYALQADTLAREKYDARYGQGEWDVNKMDAAQWLATEAPEMLPETLSPTEAANRLVWAAEYVQGRKMLTADEQQRNQMTQARQQRLMAQTARGSGTPPPTVETDEERWNAIANSGQRDYNAIRSGR
jgi:hypothetical protein